MTDCSFGSNLEKKILIHCGLKNDFEKSENKTFFWPVLIARRNSFHIDENIFCAPYHLVFSSKTAINFFYEDIFQNKPSILEKCKSIYFVGLKSKAYFSTLFPNFPENLLFASQVTGMKNVIAEFKLQELAEKIIFFTALIGKSKRIAEEEKFQSQSILIPIYFLIPYESNFLQKIFSEIYHEKKEFVFECHSGQILEQMILSLQKYFGVHHIHDIPQNISFSCFGKSTCDRINEFYEQQST